MINFWDREYKSTKRIKQGKKFLAAPFDELARWIASTWNVSVLNVIYDRANSLHKPRLQIVLEHHAQAREYGSILKNGSGNLVLTTRCK